ncbi:MULTISPECIES: hypothetical protein [Rhizobiaceae]|jgi:hypothetical protein|uniref:Uncharacterized protein n=1 Tax=Peteryoungia algae TaxID=2919917 RepID=A0ABT0CVW6_9HYPH|nr:MULTISPECIES: hypothetical protein [unclassified Rhizobium]MCC8931447.1 hypothetical protein [Rhizobium sp. 'Codium 1']MCJ8237300.1 hypothetical protein [Rhizobium sp. SSM4.3]
MSAEDQDKGTRRIHKDADGQYAGTQAGRHSDGVVSAKPTVITGSEDATVNKWPPGKENPPKDWDANFDIRDKSGD